MCVKKIKEREGGERRDRLRECERRWRGFVAAAPSLEQRAPQNDSREKRSQHQRKRIRRAAKLRREQARPADFVRHGRRADDGEANEEQARRVSRWLRAEFPAGSSLARATLVRRAKAKAPEPPQSD